MGKTFRRKDIAEGFYYEYKNNPNHVHTDAALKNNGTKKGKKHDSAELRRAETRRIRDQRDYEDQFYPKDDLANKKRSNACYVWD